MGDIITTAPYIEGLEIHALQQMRDERGSVMHVLREDTAWRAHIGEVYVSTICSGVVKGWKRHHKMTQQLVVPMGKIKLVIFDSRPDSETKNIFQEIIVGHEHYALIKIPPKVWYGFQGLAIGTSLIINCASMIYDESEVERMPIENFLPHYHWDLMAFSDDTHHE